MFKEPDVLIVKLEAHLEHLKLLVTGKSFKMLSTIERIDATIDKTRLMLALIQGAKES